MQTDINRPHPLSAHVVSKNYYTHMLMKTMVLEYVDAVNIE
jgi:hypothetical protein